MKKAFISDYISIPGTAPKAGSTDMRAYLVMPEAEIDRNGRAMIVLQEIFGVNDVMKESPTSGDVFVFFNRRRNMVKLLWYQGASDSKGFSILMHRLDSGTYTRKIHADAGFAAQSITLPELACILEQIFHKDRRK